MKVRRTLIDICFEKYNQILVLNQYDITKGPVAKLFGRDGFEKPDLQFDFGTATDLKVRDHLESTRSLNQTIFLGIVFDIVQWRNVCIWGSARAASSW